MQPLHHDDPARIGNYSLIARLGQGGMGVVYYARRYDGTLVALKVITPLFANNEKFKKRFEHEIKNAGKIDSPYVAKIIDYDITGTHWWYASEYVPGLTVADAIARYNNALPDETVRKLAYDMALALQAIHGAGIVHRDIKPQNVILSPNGIKVIDFGIAHSPDGTQLTTTDGVLGTPAYMSPEQLIKGSKPSTASDIFALGGLIIYACSGHAPFYRDGVGAHEMLLNILNGESPNMDGVPHEFRGLIEACMAHEPGNRPNAGQIHQHMQVMPQNQAAGTLFLTEVLKTAIRVRYNESNQTALRVKAMKPIPRPRKPGESNTSFRQRNQTYLKEMELWRKGERRRRRDARRAKRRVPLTIKVLALLLVGSLGYYFWPQLPGAWAKVKEHIPTDTAQAAPGVSLPDSKPYVPLPGAKFKVGKPGKTYDPDNKGSYITVTGIDHQQYQWDLTATAVGFNQHGDMAFTDSCVVARNGHSAVTVYPTVFRPGNQDGSTLTGSMVFSAVFPGNYTFYPECNQDRSVRGVSLGSVNNAGKGTLSYKGIASPVMGSRTQGNDLVVNVIPDGHGSAQYCLRGPKFTARPTMINKTSIGDIVFTELVFKNMHKGTLYSSCSEKNHNVTFHGSGVRIN